ncbi:MAG: hypothetical protein EPN84_05650 [Legionella sp.]|nr:MAG: hypothetical protein EPN84_05650 [Legionella sp.]
MKGKLDKAGVFVSAIQKAMLENTSFFGKVSSTVTSLKADQRKEGIDKLMHSLPTGRDVIYRGTIGDGEIADAVQSNRLGRQPKSSRKGTSLSIPEFVVENDSRFFLSTSPDANTVKPYAAGIPLIPCTGYIWVMGLPMVFTRPQKLLHLDRESFEAYNKLRMDVQQRDMDTQTIYKSAIDITANNNEVTVILGSEADDDWRLWTSRDVMKLVKVSGPGRILAPFMSSSEPAHVKDLTNPDFQRRVCALDVVIAYERTAMDRIIQRSIEMELIARDERPVTLNDAKALVDSGVLDELDANFSTTETFVLDKVPSSIKIGDTPALVEYTREKVKSTNRLEEKEPTPDVNSLGKE